MDITEHEADAAYLSSAALAHDAMRDGPPDFRPFAEGDVATGLQEKWTALRAAMPPEADWGPEELDNVFIATGLPGVSRKQRPPEVPYGQQWNTNLPTGHDWKLQLPQPGRNTVAVLPQWRAMRVHPVVKPHLVLHSHGASSPADVGSRVVLRRLFPPLCLEAKLSPSCTGW
eukprot:jgi/Ulvmu1/4290/UM002_0010.1